MGWNMGWRPYVSVATRKAQAAREMEKLKKQKGFKPQPVRIDGRQIASSFWGKAWCGHMEQYCDFDNRLPRGRTYVRNGSVCHLEIQKGKVVAKVSGSEIYDVEITIKTLNNTTWAQIKSACAGQVGSLLELLRGKLSDHVMKIVTDADKGLFPQSNEFNFECSCPDWADMCKHVAAVLYGVGARLDAQPELLFVLRGVEHTELAGAESASAVVSKSRKADKRTLDESQIADVFGIELAAKTATDQSGNKKSVPKKKTLARARAKTPKVRLPKVKA